METIKIVLVVIATAFITWCVVSDIYFKKGLLVAHKKHRKIEYGVFIGHSTSDNIITGEKNTVTGNENFKTK